VQAQRGLAGRLRSVDLDHPAARQAADAEGDIEPERAGGNGLDVVDCQPSPIFMMEPLPNCFSIWARAAWSALLLFSSIFCFP
jgi:hypothetical protein